jgi:hypothetical protein
VVDRGKLAEHPAAAWDSQAPVASSMAAHRKIPRRHRPAAPGRTETIVRSTKQLDQAKVLRTQRLRAGISAALHGALWSYDRVDTAL